MFDGEKFLVGQIMNFRYKDAKTKKSRRFTYKSMIIGVNKGVEMLLAPVFSISEDLNLQILSCSLVKKYYDCERYVHQNNKKIVNFKELTVSNKILNILKF